MSEANIDPTYNRPDWLDIPYIEWVFNKVSSVRCSQMIKHTQN